MEIRVFKLFDEKLKRIIMHIWCLWKCQNELWIWIMQCNYPNTI